jgi:hypothetical protein
MTRLGCRGRQPKACPAGRINRSRALVGHASGCAVSLPATSQSTSLPQVSWSRRRRHVGLKRIDLPLSTPFHNFAHVFCGRFRHSRTSSAIVRVWDCDRHQSAGPPLLRTWGLHGSDVPQRRLWPTSGWLTIRSEPRQRHFRALGVSQPGGDSRIGNERRPPYRATSSRSRTSRSAVALIRAFARDFDWGAGKSVAVPHRETALALGFIASSSVTPFAPMRAPLAPCGGRTGQSVDPSEGDRSGETP